MPVKLEWLGYRRPMGEKLWRYIKPFSYNTSVSRTDGQTDRQTDSMLTHDKNEASSFFFRSKVMEGVPKIYKVGYVTLDTPLPLSLPIRLPPPLLLLLFLLLHSSRSSVICIAPLISWSHHIKMSSIHLHEGRPCYRSLSTILDIVHIDIHHN